MYENTEVFHVFVYFCDCPGNQMVKLSVPGSYEKQICAPLKQAQTQEEGIPFVFHADRDISPSLNVCLQQTLLVGQVSD